MKNIIIIYIILARTDFIPMPLAFDFFLLFLSLDLEPSQCVQKEIIN